MRVWVSMMRGAIIAGGAAQWEGGWRADDRTTPFPREGGGPSPVGAIPNRQKMGPRLRGGTGLLYASPRSNMDRFTRHRHRRFLDRLTVRRVGVAGVGDVFGRRAEFHRLRGL